MNKVEKKRQREQHVVEEMIQLYCRKNHSKEERQGRKMCPVCQELLITQNLEVRNVRLWNRRHSVQTVRYTVINRRRERRFAR